MLLGTLSGVEMGLSLAGIPHQRGGVETAMQTLKKIFKIPVGLSDHTLDTLSCCSSVAMGGSIIEKHLTLDKKIKGADHKISLNPKEFKKMVYEIRRIEAMLGSHKILSLIHI